LPLESQATRVASALELEAGQCLGCAICVDVCPTGALALGRADLTPRQYPGRCTRCALCVGQCPIGALRLAP